MQDVVIAADSLHSYGKYILRTGTETIRELELIYGARWYETRFRGKMPILDLGPGRCWFTKQNATDIVAVDNAPAIVAHYRREGIDIRLGDAYQIPFSDEYFEGVFCCWLLEHLAEPGRAISEMYRVLKYNGYGCVIVPSPYNISAFYDDYTHVRPYTPSSLKQLAEDCGFVRYRIEYLRWVRGIIHLLRFFGSVTARRYLDLADSYLRKFRLVNKGNIMLEIWK
jgi:SAM-dependent methyltransferase